MSLNNLANRLSEQGDAASRAEALAFAREAVLLFEMAYAESPSAFERNLSIAVRNLGRIAAAEGLDPQAEINAVLNPVLSQARDGREDAATPKTKG